MVCCPNFPVHLLVHIFATDASDITYVHDPANGVFLIGPVLRSRRRQQSAPKTEWYESKGDFELQAPPPALLEVHPGTLYVHRIKAGKPQIWLREDSEWVSVIVGHPWQFGDGMRHLAFTKVADEPTWIKPNTPEYRKVMKV